MRGNNAKVSQWQGFFLMIAVFQGGYGLILSHQIAYLGIEGIWVIAVDFFIAAAVILWGEEVWQNKLWRMVYIGVLFGGLLIGVCTWQEMLNSEFLIYTPRWIALAVLIAGIVYLYFSGMETIGRLAQITVPILLGGTLGIIACNGENMSLLNILWEENGLKDYLRGIILSWPLFATVWLWPFIKEQGKMSNRTGILALLCATALIWVEHIGAMLVFAAYTKHFFWNIIEMGAVVHISGWVARLESVFICIWLIYCIILGAIALRGIGMVVQKKMMIIVIVLFYFFAVWLDNLFLLQEAVQIYGVLSLAATVVLLGIGLVERSIRWRKKSR